MFKLELNILQVSNHSWEMLNNILGSMERIRLQTLQIHYYICSAANIISRGQNSEVIHFFPENLIALKKFTEESSTLCNDMDTKLDAWFDMISELLVALVGTHSLSEEHSKDARERCQRARSGKKAALNKREILVAELENLEKYELIL